MRDIFFHQLNNAHVMVTWLPRHGTSIYGTLDFHTGTPASGGVDAMPDPGFDFNASVTKSGSSILRQSDTLTGSPRHAWRSSATTYLADAYCRAGNQ